MLTQFKRFYEYSQPGEINTGAKIIVHDPTLGDITVTREEFLAVVSNQIVELQTILQQILNSGGGSSTITILSGSGAPPTFDPAIHTNVLFIQLI